MAHGSIPGWLRHFLRLPPAPALSDAALLRRFVAEGDAEAFAALLKRHGPLVWGVCQRVLANVHDAEDAFQATFLILATRAGAIRRPDALASFLHGVARRLAVRLKQRLRGAPVLVEPVVAECPATTVSWREVLALLDEELQRLPERYRLPLVLCYLEGATRDEAAQQLGWSLATVRRRVDRGRELLHARLLRRGVTLPAALGGALLTELVVVPPTLTAAALAAARHWLAGPAEHCLISASVLSLARQGALAMGTASLRALLLVGVAILALGGGAGVYFAVRQRPASLTSPPGPAAVVDVEAASLMQTAREAEAALAACEAPEFQLVCELAALQARRGDRAAARRLFDEAGQICSGFPPPRALLMFTLAHWLTYAGDLQAASAALAEGQRLAKDVRADNLRTTLQRFAAVFTAENIDLARGLADAEAIPGYDRFFALREVATWQVETGDVDGAVRTLARQAGTPSGNLETWQVIAAAQLQAGNSDAARQTLGQALAEIGQRREKKIGTWQFDKVKVLGRFAAAQHKAGDAAGAQETLAKARKAVEQAGSRDLACLEELACAEAQTGQREAALRTLERFRMAAEPYEDDEVSWNLLLPALQALGDREGLIATLRREKQTPSDTWKKTCAALARAGQVEDARVVARAAASPQIKAWAMVGVLRGQLEQIPPARLPRYDGSLSVTVADTVSGKAPAARPSPPPDPLFEYQEIVRAYEQSWYKLNDEAAQIRDPAERRRLYQEKRPREEVTSVPLLQLAQRNPKERVAFKALAWIVEFARNTAQAETALTVLAQDHLASKKLSRVCNFARLSRHAAATEHLLRTVLAKSPHRFVRGPACLVLGEFLHDRAKVISSLRRVEHPVSAKVYEAHYGAEEMRRLQAADPEPVLKEAEACYERVLAEFADIHPPAFRDPLAKRARAGLDEIRLLAVGKTAPEIKGEDIDGKPMRLSEFRGKVVVVVFWATWCGPCMQCIPAEKELVRRLQGRPFVLLGVNGDPDRAKLRERLTKDPLPWRSWWDGLPDGAKGSRIAEAWNVTGWPTVYVLGPHGVIRYRDLFGQDLDQAIEKLLKEAEAAPCPPMKGPGWLTSSRKPRMPTRASGPSSRPSPTRAEAAATSIVS